MDKIQITYALVNENPQTPPPGPGGNVGHRWGIRGYVSIEQAPGGGGLANFGLFFYSS